jgi:hypothetical protein
MELREMPPHSRIWVYQSVTELSPELVAQIHLRARNFIGEWASHGNKLQAVAEVLHHRFVVVAVDEGGATASGCGIDKSFRFIQDLEREFQISLLNRTHVAWEGEGKIQSASQTEFEVLLANGKVNSQTLVFNNLIETKAQLDHSWRIPLLESWHARLLASRS